MKKITKKFDLSDLKNSNLYQITADSKEVVSICNRSFPLVGYISNSAIPKVWKTANELLSVTRISCPEIGDIVTYNSTPFSHNIGMCYYVDEDSCNIAYLSNNITLKSNWNIGVLRLATEEEKVKYYKDLKNYTWSSSKQQYCKPYEKGDLLAVKDGEVFKYFLLQYISEDGGMWGKGFIQNPGELIDPCIDRDYYFINIAKDKEIYFCPAPLVTKFCTLLRQCSKNFDKKSRRIIDLCPFTTYQHVYVRNTDEEDYIPDFFDRPVYDDNGNISSYITFRGKFKQCKEFEN